MAVFDEKWLKRRESISRTGIFMFNNDLLSDVTPSKKKYMFLVPARFIF